MNLLLIPQFEWMWIGGYCSMMICVHSLTRVMIIIIIIKISVDFTVYIFNFSSSFRETAIYSFFFFISWIWIEPDCTYLLHQEIEREKRRHEPLKVFQDQEKIHLDYIKRLLSIFFLVVPTLSINILWHVSGGGKMINRHIDTIGSEKKKKK